MTRARASLREMWASRRVRILLTSILLGMLSGVTMIALPVEDILIGARTVLRRQDVPQNIVVVNLDDASLSELGEYDAPRTADAQLVERLIAAGANRVFFDRAFHFREDPQEDAALARAVARHEGRVFMGAVPSADDPDDAVSRMPAPLFRDHVGITSLAAFAHPFKLSWSLPFASRTPEGVVPTLSAKLAGFEGSTDGFYRVDFAFDAASIPHVSYADVLYGRASPDLLRGRDIVVAPTAITFNDIHYVPFQGYFPGAYIQVMAAHTLKSGAPVKLGWLPLLALTSIVVISGIGRGRSFDRYRVAGLVGILGVLPLALDFYRIEVEIIPAALTAAIAIFRARALDRVEDATDVNVASGLPSLQSLRTLANPPSGSLVALKIRNYGAITGSFDTAVEDRLAAEVVRRIGISDPDRTVYHQGDMFFWISGLANPLDIFENLEGLHRIVQNGIRIRDREIDLSFNCGVDAEEDRAMGARIANAMQAAERAVRTDELVVQHDSGENEVQWEISLLSSLDRAIDSGQVWVAYQPKLDIRTGQIASAEALVRWTHPERGPIPPDQFIRIAEEYHRIERITQFVLHEAVREAARIVRGGVDFTVSVNISAQLLRFPGLPRMITDALEAHDLAPRHLTLEITETDRLDRSSATFAMMERLVGLGLRLSIDDFGTGNATIDYLRYLPASEVKIDRVFIQGIEESEADRLLVQSIIDMAHSLGRKVVAEGVENQTVLESLRAMGCDEVQGYHVSRPVRIEDFVQLLEGRQQQRYG